MNFLEALGYTGTLFIILSFLFKDIIKLRLLNIIGASMVTIYAWLSEVYPVVLLDGSIVLINAYYLFIFYRQKVRCVLG